MHHVLKSLQTWNHVPRLHLAIPGIRIWEGACSRSIHIETSRRVGNWRCSRCDFMMWILWNVVFTVFCKPWILQNACVYSASRMMCVFSQVKKQQQYFFGGSRKTIPFFEKCYLTLALAQCNSHEMLFSLGLCIVCLLLSAITKQISSERLKLDCICFPR